MCNHSAIVRRSVHLFTGCFVTLTLAKLTEDNESFAQSNIQSLHTKHRKGNRNYDVAIIGGGVVGLAVAQKLASSTNKLKIVVVEKEDSIAAGASSGNSGLGCTGYDAPVGSLERQLLRRSIRLHPPLYRSLGLHAGHDGHVRKSGSLVVAWNDEQLEKLPDILAENRAAGDEDACLLTREELLEMSPELSQEARGAVYCPYEAVVEPWLVPVGLAIRARELGVDILTGRKVVDITQNVTTMDMTQKGAPHWTISTVEAKGKEVCSMGRSAKGQVLVMQRKDSFNCNEGNASTSSDSAITITAGVVINCAGLFGDEIEQLRQQQKSSVIADKAGVGGDISTTMPRECSVRPFVVTPRKGQFVVFRPKAHLPTTCEDLSWKAPSMIIEPVPTERTKGVILWQTMYGTIVVGPTATDQQSKDDRSTDMTTLEELIAHGRRVMPGLEHWEVIGSYSGLRPATEHRDYQIFAYPEQQWICVGGIRSTGLTAATGIAEYVVQELYKGGLGMGVAIGADGCTGAAVGTLDYSMGVSEAASNTIRPPETELHSTQCSFRYDGLADISQQYVDNEKTKKPSEQTYLTFNGYQYRVTHPISSFGMENYKYISDIYKQRNGGSHN